MFAHPLLLHALWLIPALTFLQWRAFRSQHRASDALVAQHLRGSLITHTSASRVWAIFALYMLAFACLVIAAAQPRYGEERREIPEAGKNAIIAIDTSRSMMADDILPNRLTRAKLAAQDILATLSGYRVGLIAFAGKAYVQAPLTTDHAAIVESIEALDCFTVPRGGTKLGEVMAAAFDAFKDSGSRNHGLILLTDGGDDDPDVQAMLKRARDQQVRIVAIGCGTDVGSLIPNPEPDRTTEFVIDPATNKPVHSKLEDATLRRLASETGGRYLTLGPQAINTTLVKQVLDLLETTETGKRERVKPIERFQWPLALGIVSLMSAMLLRPTVKVKQAASPFSRASVRQATSLSTIALTALISTAADASWTGPKQMTSDDALRAYSDKEYSRSRDLYARLYGESKNPELAYGLGSSALKLHEYERANQAFSNALEASDTDLRYRAHRGIATNLWDQGKGLLQGRPEVTLKAWIDALRHFDSALQLRPGDAETQANRDYVAKFIEQVKQAIEQKKQAEQQQGDKSNKDDKDDKKEDGDKKDKGDKGDKGDDGQKGEEGEDGKDGKPSKNKDGKDGKKGKDGKDGDPSDDTSNDSKDGKSDKNKDGKEGDKQSDENGTDKDKADAKKDDQNKAEADGKDKKDGTPKGQIETKDQSDGKQPPEEGEPVEIVEPTNEETGFNPNDARNQLRTYTDEQRVKVQRRREFGAKRDW